MTALCNVLGFQAPERTAADCAAAAAKVTALLKNMVLFLASPFIGLAYAVLLPFVGLGMLLWIAAAGMRKARGTPAAAEVAGPVAAPPEPA